jgi:hypothetical protein
MFILQSVFLLLPIDIISLALKPILKKQSELIKKTNYALTLLVILIFLIYVPARIIYDHYAVELREVTFNKKNLPRNLSGFKIAFISDIQADWYTNTGRLSNFMNKVNSAKPDLILMAGDIITGSPDYIKLSAEQLSKLKAPYGIYTCVGDHDNWAYRGDLIRSRREVTRALADYNIHMLDNINKVIPIDSSAIGISFITESYSQRISNRLLDSLLENVQSGDLKIVITHQPADKIISKAIEKNTDLMLSGHTHGGQITFIFPFVDLTPTLFETKHVKGDFYYDNMHLIINRGLGMSLVPLRYNSTPEITLITLN